MRNLQRCTGLCRAPSTKSLSLSSGCGDSRSMSAIAESDSDSATSIGTGTTGTDGNESLQWSTIDERAFVEVAICTRV